MIRNIDIKHSNIYDFIFSIVRLAHLDMREMQEDKPMPQHEKIKFDENIIKWIKSANEKFTEERKQTRVFFFNRELIFFKLLVYYVRYNEFQTIDEYLSFLKNEDPKKMMSKYLYLFSTVSKKADVSLKENEAEKLIQNSPEAMAFAEKAKISHEKKWDMLQLCLHPEDKKNELIEFLEWYYSEIYKKVEQKAERVVKKQEKELKRKLKAYGNEYLSILANIEYKHDIHRNITFIISYFTEIGYFIFIMGDVDEDLYIIGFRHMELYVERKHGLLSNVQIFKTLGDETRQNIIKLLAKKEWYGDELAQEMNLSNSTVSYHLNMLLLEGFVKLNRVEKRSYFTLNKDKLKKILDEALLRMLDEK